MGDEHRLARRDQRRRAVTRRRRAAAASALLTIAVVALVLVLLTGGSSHSRAQSATRAASAKTAHPRTPPPNRAQGHRGLARDGAALGRATDRPGTAAVPILMYHVINSPPAGAPFPGLYVQPQEFAAQMQALEQAGWHAVTLDQVEAYWTRGVPLGPGKPIVLSFDNGYQSQYSEALPILRRLGWVGDENIQLTGLPPSQGGLGEREVRAMVEDGWELDTQGISHADLVTLDAAQLRHQIADARRALQQRYDVPVDWFCYPSGHYDAAVVAEVRAAGFVGSTTVVPGWAHSTDDPYRLHRLRVLGGTTPEQLLELLQSARLNGAAPASYNGGAGSS